MKGYIFKSLWNFYCCLIFQGYKDYLRNYDFKRSRPGVALFVILKLTWIYMNWFMPSFVSDCEHAHPPQWLQTLMSACSQASDFSVQSVAVSLVMDLVGLTQSVAMVTGESVNSMEPAQPLSPNQGRVAVVIRPPLTQGNLRYIAEKTEFFKVNSKKSRLYMAKNVAYMMLYLGHWSKRGKSFNYTRRKQIYMVDISVVSEYYASFSRVNPYFSKTPDRLFWFCVVWLPLVLGVPRTNSAQSDLP